MKNHNLRRRRRVYWCLLPIALLTMTRLFVMAKPGARIALDDPQIGGLIVVLLATLGWWIVVPSSVIGRCPGCREWFFASLRMFTSWPGGNPFRSTCWNCGASVDEAPRTEAPR